MKTLPKFSDDEMKIMKENMNDAFNNIQGVHSIINPSYRKYLETGYMYFFYHWVKYKNYNKAKVYLSSAILIKMKKISDKHCLNYPINIESRGY